MCTVDVATALSGALGLSGAAGLNAWIPLFATGLLHRLDVLDVAAPYDELATTPGLIIVAVLLVADFVGDKVPAVDSALHAVGAVVSPLAGAVVFAGQAGVVDEVPPVISLITGGAVAGAFHATRSGARPVVTALTAGLGNPAVSLAEDIVSTSFTAVAVVVPLLAFLLIPAAFVALLLAGRAAVRRMRGPTGPGAGGPPPPAA